ncbi:MAG: cadherin-like beta sandwich domain-containing protein [Prevotella sp.]|nr:cadherin-like beta sandwich domain-containing protein [Prevotella sp.]
MKKLVFSLSLMLFAISSMAGVSITGQGGWFESAYVTWQKVSGLEYNVYVSPAASDSWMQLDEELVREYPAYGRADAMGLTAGNYKFKVVPVQNGNEIAADAAVSETVEVRAHDRSGFAHHKAGSEGIGAYNNDGTLKQNARVVYVWADNAKTVSLDVAKNVKGETVTYTGLQQIIYGYQKGDANGSYEKRPLCVRIIGTIKDTDMDEFGSSAEGLQIKGQKAYGPMNITIEGVGNDAAFWGFGILIRNAAKVELRNFGIYLCMDDCVSIDTNNAMIWVHNVDFFYGKTGGDADQAKGDGALDFKGDSQYCTFSYNHFYDTGKSNLGGLSESGDNYITLHHNWYDHSDSRHPRIRRMSMHIYNNYFDGNSKYGVGMTSGGSAFVENNYFRNCKYPMLISMQGSDIRYGKGTFSSEPGGIIKSYGNTIVNPAQYVTYQQNQTEFDAWEATSRNAQVPSTVVCKSGNTTYNNFDTDANIMYSYTPDAAADVPAIVKGQYGAGRMQHGDFTWTFNNSVQDMNYGVINDLKSALQSYKSTLVGFFGGETVSNGGASQPVDGGDGKGLTQDQQDSYVPTWAGGSGEVTSAGLPDPNFCGPESEAGSNVYDYLWFNTDNKTKIEGFIADGLITLSEGGSFNATRELKNGDGTLVSQYTGSLQLPKDNGTATFKCLNGVSSIAFAIFRTGSATGEIQVSKNGTSFTKISDYSAAKGDATVTATASGYAEGPVWVRITNKATGALHITGIKIMYPGAGEDEPDDPIDDTTADASFEFTLNGNSLAFIGDTATETLEFDDPVSTMTIEATPNAEGATIQSVTGATLSNGKYTFNAPAMGQTTTVSFTTLAANGITTKSYTINVTRDIDPSTIPVETGTIMLQSDNIPEGYKVNGSSSVTAYTYNSDLCRDAKLFKVAAGQHTVTLPANAKITKIVMYAVGDNNTANKGKITELAGQTFSVDLPSRKNGTALAQAVVDNVSITRQFTFTVSYAAGVKFQLTVEQATSTGINTVQTAGENATEVYDLTGRRVNQTQPGTLYIQNGKKFVAF